MRTTLKASIITFGLVALAYFLDLDYGVAILFYVVYNVENNKRN